VTERSTPETVIRLQAVSRWYDSEAERVVAVEGVDLDVDAGEFVCVHGTSGSGKTTLLNLIGGVDEPDAGKVVVGDFQVSSMSPEERIVLRREVVGMVHQQDSLIEEFTAVENVSLPLEVAGYSPEAALDAASAELVRVGLEGLEGRLPRQLSGGQRQRVGIARALTGGRLVLLADEPTGALDTASATVVYRLLVDLAQRGIVVVVASHDPQCRTYASRVVEIRDGRLVGKLGAQV